MSRGRDVFLEGKESPLSEVISFSSGKGKDRPILTQKLCFRDFATDPLSFVSIFLGHKSWSQKDLNSKLCSNQL